MKTLNYLLILMVAVLLVGCAQYAQQPATTQPAAPAQQPPVAAKAPAAVDVTPQTNDVMVKDFAFVPKELVVKKGTTVTWTNYDSVSHIIAFSDSESPSLGKAQVYSKKFDKAGTFEYHCSIHSSMLGTVIVE